EGREAGEVRDEYRQLMPLLVAWFCLNLRQLVAKQEQDRIDSLIQVRVVHGQPALRFERGDRFHQRLAAYVCLAHARYYINSCARTRTAGRTGERRLEMRRGRCSRSPISIPRRA